MWKSRDEEEVVWHRSFRTSPTHLICKEKQFAVHVFHGNSVVDEIVHAPVEGEDTSVAEKRISSDDEAYTLQEFQEFFGMIEGEHRWQRASIAENCGSPWIWYHKELNRVWSAIAESGHGSFGVHDTVVLEQQMKALCSHPENVIEVVVWGHLSDRDDESQVQSLRECLKQLVDNRPNCILEQLKRYKC